METKLKSPKKKQKQKKERKKPTRRVFARLKGIEAHDKVWTVELTKQGVRVRERCHRRVDLIDFSKLCLGGGVEIKLTSGEQFSFMLSATGLEITHKKSVKTLKWEQLANLGRQQIEMFPELVTAAA